LVEDVTNLATCWYVDFPNIGTIDLDTLELPSNDQEMLEVATKRMFAEPSILDTITSVVSVLRQYEGVGGSALPAASEAAERVLEESTTGTESDVVVSPPSPAGEGTGASLPHPAEVVTAAPAASVVDVAEGLLREVGPPSPRPVATATEEILRSGQPAAPSQECDTPEGTTSAASPEI
jgi:hypothetical protein